MRRSKGDPQVTRCLGLLLAMARSHDGVPLRPLAERRGWNLRALYRDIDVLESVGVPVRKDGDRYSVDAEWLPPGAAGVTKDELTALFVARRFAPGLRGTKLGKLLDSMHAKLSAPGKQGALDLEPGDGINVRMLAPIDYSQHRATIELLEEAIRLRRAVAITYRRPAGDPTDRVIEPGYLHWDGAAEAMYVIGWCRLREDVRNFAVHRIRGAKLTDERFSPRPETRRSELVRAFRLWYGRQAERVVIWFGPDVAEEIRERRWHPTQRLRELPDGAIELQLHVTAPEELTRWLMGFGPSALVVEPDQLAASIRRSHSVAAARAGRTGGPVLATDATHGARHGLRAKARPNESDRERETR